MLACNVRGLWHVDVKLELIRKYHDCPHLANAMDCIKHKVLIGPPMDSDENAVAPSDSFAGDSPFTGSPFEPQSLAKEWQPRRVVGSSDIVVRGTSISTNNTSEAYKGFMLNEPCNQWVRDGHMFAQ